MLFSSYDSTAGKTIIQDIIVRPRVAILMLSGFFSGIAAFFCGIFGIIKKKDYSILVFISTAFGSLILLWLLIHLFFPD